MTFSTRFFSFFYVFWCSFSSNSCTFKEHFVVFKNIIILLALMFFLISSLFSIDVFFLFISIFSISTYFTLLFRNYCFMSFFISFTSASISLRSRGKLISKWAVERSNHFQVIDSNILFLFKYKYRPLGIFPLGLFRDSALGWRY